MLTCRLRNEATASLYYRLREEDNLDKNMNKRNKKKTTQKFTVAYQFENI